ncbi:hypothetical protein K450DRAFT_230473 [Umbelopsis ramanniana AG]|uniref:RRM domain-containing protein n=1 Tax=Umbelopsis ramanniana AG TaxID=1314678 RepID=A0AAD5EGV1_UMBRA|nr:uncharacterized protein K450DRAFT_230473 [Umbelopsis ramanniana AG]KAI8582025.1 hypothetical protein K450DRAFT_230473 [Umbelopsis ramanniana AG]KAI9286919.1 hypothetical protein BC943DRAFT_320266 [Umbelopsis sp. AD052]
MSNDGALDMALDDVIVTNKAGRRGARRGPSGGVNKRSGGAPRARNTPYSRPVANARAQPPRSNHLLVSNLHYQVTEKDLYDLFGQIGKVRKAFIHLGPSGKSTGVADVIFDNNRDADKALASYNDIELDRRPMRIAYAAGPAAPVAVAAPVRSQPRSTRGGNSRGRGGRGGRGGRRSEGQPKKSQEELDAEMDNYMQAPPAEDTAMES